jgi:SAM-dependent methyltransferase
MGIAPYIAEAILREHTYRPITGTVLTLGRQTMFFTPSAALAMMAGFGIPPAPVAVETDKNTNQRMDGGISDKSFFSLLGAARVLALDHSDYEGADLVHDLNTPIPPELRGIADFILDGSTLDNVFNPAQAIQNIAAMLRPGGRALCINVGDFKSAPYTVPAPAWYLDYFTVNGFIDARIYVTAHWNNLRAVLTPDLAAIAPGGPLLNHIETPLTVGIVAFAEKGLLSTSDTLPSQQYYRQPEGWADYSARLVTRSPRPELLRSNAPCFVRMRDGYRFVNAAGEAETAPRSAHALMPGFLKRAIGRMLTRSASASSAR